MLEYLRIDEFVDDLAIYLGHEMCLVCMFSSSDLFLPASFILLSAIFQIFANFFANPSINIIHFSSIRKEENQYVPRFIYFFMLHKVWKHYNNFTFESPMSLHFKPKYIKVALSQKVEVDFPNCPKWVPKKLSWDLENENSDSFLRLQV